jgi:uncharacterized protein (DUF2336 family)
MSNEGLIVELESAVTLGSSERRVEMLRRVTRLFLADADRLSGEQLDFVDDVLLRIGARVEARTLAKLSAVRWQDQELIAIAQTRGPAHLMAVSERQILCPDVTDALLQRADTGVTRRLARNFGARFSPAGYDSMVRRADADEILAGVLGIRPDLPPQFLRQLLLHATDAARERLLATAPAAVEQLIHAALAGLEAEFSSARPDAAAYSEAETHIIALNRIGKLTNAAVNRFAIEKQTANIIVAIAVCCSVKPETIEPLMLDPRTHDLVLACKAAGLSWQTTQMILMNRVAGHTLSRTQADEAQATFESQSLAAAQCTIQSWAASAAVKRTA